MQVGHNDSKFIPGVFDKFKVLIATFDRSRACTLAHATSRRQINQTRCKLCTTEELP